MIYCVIKIIQQYTYSYSPGYVKKDDSWFQYYYDVIGYPHADDPKGNSRDISDHLKWRFGVRSEAHTSQIYDNLIITCTLLLQIYLFCVIY